MTGFPSRAEAFGNIIIVRITGTAILAEIFRHDEIVFSDQPPVDPDFENPKHLIEVKNRPFSLFQSRRLKLFAEPCDTAPGLLFAGGCRIQKGGVKKVEDFADTLLEYIRSNGGSTPLNDKTEADVIYSTFGVSKKTFKKAVGDLYKKRLIVLEGEQGIRLA